MKRTLRWAAYGLALLLFVALALAAWVWIASSRVYDRSYAGTPEPLPKPTPLEVADAPRLARVLGCHDCHGEDLRGKLMFDQPHVAKVWAPNLTLVAAEASDAQLARAIRQGIGRDGHALWIMPSGLFSRLPDREVAALLAYLKSLPPGGEARPDIELGPLGRVGIATGRFRPAPALVEEFRSREPYYVDREHEAGRQIAARVCADCHGADLSGGQVGFDRTPPDLVVASGYDRDAFRRLLRRGESVSGRDLGLMRRIALNSLSALRDDEIDALHAYLVARAGRLGR